MKAFYLWTLVVSCLIVSSKVMQAQTKQTPLNQIELMKQWIGTWKTEGTYLSSEIHSYGIDGLEGFQKIQFKDSIISEYKFIYGYDKNSDKYIFAAIGKNSPGVILMAFWFTEKNLCERIPYEYISNPEQASSRAIYEFKSNNSVKATFVEKNKPVRVYTIIRQ
jgi:hypothetical protein